MIYKEKHCNGCKKLKQPEEYSKCRRRKDGLQPKCKECNKKDNKHFRKNLRPDYWSFETGYFSDKIKTEYISLYCRADKPIKIYMILFDDGSKYIGSTKTHLHLRLNRHLADFRRVEQGHRSQCIPLLHEKFREFDSIEKIKEHLEKNTKIITEVVGSKTKQYRLEAWWIKKLRKEGHTLLNKTIPHRYKNIKI